MTAWLRDGDHPELRIAAAGGREPEVARAGAAPLFRIVEVGEPGQIAAINAGLPHASGDVVTFPDDDCVPRPDWLRRLLSHYADPRVGGAGGRDVVHADGLPEPPSVSLVGAIAWYGRIIGNHHCKRRRRGPPGAAPQGREHVLPAGTAGALRPPLIRGPHINDTDISLAVHRTGRLLIFDPEARVDHYPAPRPDTPGGRDLLDPRLAFVDSPTTGCTCCSSTSRGG